MVAVEQYNSDVRPSPLAGVLRLLGGVSVRAILTSPKYLFRRTDAERQRRAVRIAERVSAAACLPTAPPLVEPARLAADTITAYLRPAAVMMEHAADQATITTSQAAANLDRIAYDLEAIRSEIAPYLTDEPARPCESRHAHVPPRA